MAGYRPREDTLATAIDRMEDLRESFQAVIRGLVKLAHNQDIQTEMLGKILTAVTKPAEGGQLEELLAALVEQGGEHTEMLRSLLDAAHHRE